MALKKDKKKVLGEVFDEERIKSFLEIQPYGDMNADYHLLEKAYRGMKAENFATFVKFFQQQGRDINATNHENKTLLQVVKEHRLGEEYADILQQAGGH